MATSDSPLNVPDVTLAVARGAGPTYAHNTPIVDLPAGNIVNDNFETGDMSAANNPDFEWQKNHSTSVVTMDPDMPHCTATGPYAVYNNKQICNPPPDPNKDWNAILGDYSLRFRYSAGYNPSAFAEQRWNLTSSGERELWQRFALRVPPNFQHGSNQPSNNKLNTFWTDGYATTHGTGGTMLWEFWGDANNPGSSRVSMHWIEGDGQKQGHQQHTPFISYPDDQGRLMYLCFNVIISSAKGEYDGEARMWRRWSDESEWTKLHEVVGIRLDPPDPESGVVGLREGYVMGANQSGYAEETEFLMGQFALSTENLL